MKLKGCPPVANWSNDNTSQEFKGGIAQFGLQGGGFLIIQILLLFHPSATYHPISCSAHQPSGQQLGSFPAYYCQVNATLPTAINQELNPEGSW